MKRFLFLSMLVFIIIMIWVSVHEKEDDMPLPQKLERAMRLTRMMEYKDCDYGYSVRYPSFFEPDDSLMDGGCCRFSFWQDIFLLMTDKSRAVAIMPSSSCTAKSGLCRH